jgi:Predicted transcriptional regulators
LENKFSLEYKSIGLNISYYRKLKGYTQLQLADKVNISRTHMSNIEAPNVPTSVSLEVLLSIAKELGIPAYKLLIFSFE